MVDQVGKVVTGILSYVAFKVFGSFTSCRRL